MQKANKKEAQPSLRPAQRAQRRLEIQNAEQALQQQRQAEIKDTQMALRLRQQADREVVPQAKLREHVALELALFADGRALHQPVPKSDKPRRSKTKNSLATIAADAVLNSFVNQHEAAANAKGRPREVTLSPDIVIVEASKLWRTAHYNQLLKDNGIFKTVEARRIHQHVAQDKPPKGVLNEAARLEMTLYGNGQYAAHDRPGKPKPGVSGLVVAAYEGLATASAPIHTSALETEALRLWRAERLQKLLKLKGVSGVTVKPISPRPVLQLVEKPKPPRDKKKKADLPEGKIIDIKHVQRRSEGLPSNTMLRVHATKAIANYLAIQAGETGIETPKGRLPQIAAQAVLVVDAEVKAHNATLPPEAAKRKLSTGAVIERTSSILREQRRALHEEAPREPASAKAPSRIKPIKPVDLQPDVPNARRLKRLQAKQNAPAQPGIVQMFNQAGRALGRQAQMMPQLLQSLRAEPEGAVPDAAVSKALKLASYLERNAQPQRALSLLTLLSQKQPENGDVQLQLAFARGATGNTSAALKTFAVLMDVPAMRAPALAGMAQTYLQTNRPRQALNVLSRETVLSAELQQLQAAAQSDLEARAAVTAPRQPRIRRETTIHDDQAELAGIMSEAAALTKQGQHADAQKVLRRALRRDETYTPAMLALSASYVATGDLPRAETLLLDAQRYNATAPEVTKALVGVVATYEEKGDARRAEELLVRAQAQAPGEPTLRGRMGDLLAKRDRPEDAAGAYRDVLKADPNNMEAARKLMNLTNDVAGMGWIRETCAASFENREKVPCLLLAGNWYLRLAEMEKAKPESTQHPYPYLRNNALDSFSTAYVRGKYSDRLKKELISAGRRLDNEGGVLEWLKNNPAPEVAAAPTVAKKGQDRTMA